MFDIIREYFETRRHFSNIKRKTDRLVAARARADREAVARMASVVEGIQAMLGTWLKGPSTSSEYSGVAADIFLSRVMQGIAGGAGEVSDYLTEKADAKRKYVGLKTTEQRKADDLARIIGTVHMAMGKSVSFIVEAGEATRIATVISELCPQEVTIEDTDETDKSLLIVRDASETDGKGGDVH